MIPSSGRRSFLLASLASLAWLPRNSQAASRFTVSAAVVGQSNEQGVGRSPDVKLTGELVQDPIPPNGGMRSWWPYLAKRLRHERSIELKVRNTAVGSTSLCDSWAGRVRIWKKGMLLVKGSYCLTQEGVFKLQNSTNAVVSSQIIPTPSSVGTELQDGCVWVLARAGATSLGVIDPKLSPDLFDPNGYIKRVVDEIESVAANDKWAFVSIGQTDKTIKVSKSDFAQAVETISGYLTKRGIKVLLGFTCYGATPGLDDWFQLELIPGLKQASERLSENPLVYEGANLREALGKLPIIESDEVPGLQPDMLHLNNAGYIAAANAWFDAIDKARIVPLTR